MTRRVVLQHTDGSLAGMCQIWGTLEDLAEMFNPALLPADVTIPDGPRFIRCSLVKVEPTYVLYREVTPIA